MILHVVSFCKLHVLKPVEAQNHHAEVRTRQRSRGMDTRISQLVCFEKYGERLVRFWDAEVYHNRALLDF